MIEYPHLLQIETTALCNARCVFCPHKSLSRPLGQMSWDLFVKVIQQCKKLRIKQICPFLNGEPFLDSLIFDRLNYINQELPNVELAIFTNMSLLGPLELQALSRIKNIDTFFMSLTSYNSISCKKYMNLDFNSVYRNVSNLIKLNKEKKFIKSLQGSSIHMNLAENKKFKDCWSNLGIDNYFISAKENWLGEVQSSKKSDQNVICPRAFHLCVFFDGTVPLCCFDSNGTKTFGNIKDTMLLEIYNSKEYRHYRVCVKKDLEPCNRCTV